MTNKEIATVILSQLGGSGRLNAMLGVKQLTIVENGLSIKYKVSSPVNYIKITLNGLDLYNIEMGKIWGSNYKIVNQVNDIFAEDMKNIIENICKVRLSL